MTEPVENFAYGMSTEQAQHWHETYHTAENKTENTPVEFTHHFGSRTSNINIGSAHPMFFIMLLMLAQTEISSNNMRHQAGKIQGMQKEMKKIQHFINAAVKGKLEAGNEGATHMPPELTKYMDVNGLDYDKTGNDVYQNKEEWTSVITSLEGQLQTLQGETELQMVNVKQATGKRQSAFEMSNWVFQQMCRLIESLTR